jgi:hypothetical protein
VTRVPLLVGVLCLVLFAGMKLWPTVALSHDAQGYPGYHAAIDPPLADFDDPRLKRANGEGDLAFAGRVTHQVFRATYHCDYTFTGHTWATALIAAINPAFLTDQGILAPSGFRCGFCHQRAWILAETLGRGGLDASVRGLEGHVVTTFDYEGQNYVADPDAGVGPFAVSWDDPARLSAVIRATYTMPGGEVYLPIFTATADDWFYSLPYLRAVASAQDRILRAAEVLEWTLLFGGFGLIAATFVRSRQSANR